LTFFPAVQGWQTAPEIGTFIDGAEVSNCWVLASFRARTPSPCVKGTRDALNMMRHNPACEIQHLPTEHCPRRKSSLANHAKDEAAHPPSATPVLTKICKKNIINT
jgi:hypothetical protein